MPDGLDRDTPPSAAVPGLLGLFGGFFGISIVGFGGVLPWVRRLVVEQRRWMTGAEFNDLLALCQFLPGPNVVNMAVAIGGRFHGVAGSAACLGGLMAAPMAIVIALGGIYDRYGHLPLVAHAFGGLAAAASGLVVATSLKIAAPLRSKLLACAVAVTAFVAVALLRLPLLPTMLILSPASILLSWRFAW